MIAAVGIARDQTFDEFCIPSSDKYADREDSQDLGADSVLPSI